MQIAPFVPGIPVKLSDQRQFRVRQSVIRVLRGNSKSRQAEMNPVKTAVGRERVSDIKVAVAGILRMKGQAQKSAFLLEENPIGNVQKHASSRFKQVRNDDDTSGLLDYEQPIRLTRSRS